MEKKQYIKKIKIDYDDKFDLDSKFIERFILSFGKNELRNIVMFYFCKTKLQKTDYLINACDVICKDKNERYYFD
jgi:hypothetical protein